MARARTPARIQTGGRVPPRTTTPPRRARDEPEEVVDEPESEQPEEEEEPEDTSKHDHQVPRRQEGSFEVQPRRVPRQLGGWTLHPQGFVR